MLLFQDIAVIPILALIPLLATSAAAAPARGGACGRRAWSRACRAGRRRWRRWRRSRRWCSAGSTWRGRSSASSPRARLREIFTAAALAVVIGNALLMAAVGLSPALGAFLAGVVLADSEFRHELESDIEPFKGLLLGLFFITVGAGDRLRALAAAPLTVLGGGARADRGEGGGALRGSARPSGCAARTGCSSRSGWRRRASSASC